MSDATISSFVAGLYQHTQYSSLLLAQDRQALNNVATSHHLFKQSLSPSGSSSTRVQTALIPAGGCALGGLGGAVAVDTAKATVGDSIFTDNSARSQGGGVYQV